MRKYKGKTFVWLMVTSDKYELPLAVTDTAQEMAAISGTTANSVRTAYSHFKLGECKTCKYRRVEIG